MNTNFLIKLELQDNELIATVNGDFLEDDLFYFYLLKYARVESRIDNWIRERSCKFQLKSSGAYSCQAHLKRGNVNIQKRSVPITYISDFDKNEYYSFLDRRECGDIPPLKYYKLKNHYQDFGIILHQKNNQSQSQVDFKYIDNDLFTENVYLDDLLCQIIYAKDIVQEENYSFIFSGVLAYKNRLYLGSKEVDCSILKKIQNEVGSYIFLRINKTSGEIDISTDYFGIGKIYYYCNNGIFVASNRYHFLLLILKNLGIKLKLDKNKALSSLVFLNMQPFHQNISRKMDIEGVFVLPVNKTIYISSKGVDLPSAKIDEVFTKKEPFSEENYQKLLREAKKEIINNVKIALEHPAFKYVILDLSGGMDSRIVYGAATHLQEFRHKIRINSHFVESEPLDLDVALSINSIYGFQYDDLPTIKEPYYGDNPWNDIWSYYLGVYYSYVPPFYKNKIPDAIRLVGSYGEICARPYYSRSLLNTDLDVDDPTSFIDRYFERYQYMSFVGDECGCLSLLKNLFCEELDLLPGDSALEKLENHYLFYRNSLHFSDVLRSDVRCPEWGALMSKALFQLKNMTYHRFKSIKLQLDISNLVNPVIAAHIYEYDKDNLEKQKLIDKGDIILYGECFDNIKIGMNNDNKEWLEAQERKKRNVNTVATDDRINKKYKNIDNDRNTYFLIALKYLIKKGVLDQESVGQSVWLFFNKYSDNPDMRGQVMNLTNRIMSIYYQFILFE